MLLTGSTKMYHKSIVNVHMICDFYQAEI